VVEIFSTLNSKPSIPKFEIMALSQLILNKLKTRHYAKTN